MDAIIESPARDAVMSFINALNAQDYETARKYTQDDMQFVGVLGERDGAEAYFKDMKKMRLQYEIRKIFVDEDDVCLLYDIDMSGKKIFTCGWYHVEEGKINSIHVIFDPRPVLESFPKK